MKTMLVILPLAGAALLVSAAEPVKPEPMSSDATAMSVTKDSANATRGGSDAADKAYAAGLGEQLARSGAVTVKPRTSVTKGVLQSLNPLAPTKPEPTTPWLSRAPWSAAAERGTASSTPVEMRHEAKFGVVVYSQ